MPGLLPRQPLVAVVLCALLFGIASAHEHHEVDTGPYEHNFSNEEEIDSTLYWHICIQITCWGLLFPAGMVMGLTRSRFHVPWQSLTVLLSLFGTYLGHHHAGRSFHMTAHAHFASYLWWYTMLQTAFGVFLKMHVMEGTAVRKAVVVAHGVVGKSFPVVGWTQMIFGGIAALGFCFGDHLGQCLAHFIMGSGFIAYAAILLIMFRVGTGWLARRQVSQEFLDSWIICLWGIVNTFTEHNFLKPGQLHGWNHKDLQHTSLGVLWWAGGALGIVLSRKGRRSIIPAIIIAMTGFAMARHGQALEFSTDVHQFFGGALMAAGAARVVEICFILKDAPAPSENPKSFQHLTPFLLVLSGLTFLSATEEQMHWLASSVMDSNTYSILLFSLAFGMYLVGVVLVDLYEYLAGVREKARAREEGGAGDVEEGQEVDEEGGVRRWREEREEEGGEPVRVFGLALPALLGKLVRFARQLEGDGRGRGGALGERGGRGHLRSSTADYEAMPLTAGRESVDLGGGGGAGAEEVEMMRRESSRSRGGSGSGSGTVGSDETVFDIGEDDDGGEGWWEEKEERGRKA